MRQIRTVLQRVLRRGLLRQPIERFARRLSPSGRVLSLLVLGGIVYLLVSLLTATTLWEMSTEIAGPHNDLEVYIERAEQVLSGAIPYRDFYTESPPLIIYLFVPAQVLGPSVFSYAIWFGMLAVLTGILVYLLLKELNPPLAYVAAVFFMFSPATLMTSSVLVQDEIIVSLFFLLPLLLLLNGFRNASSAAVVVGALTKVYSAFLAPLVIMMGRNWRERVRQVGVMAVATLIIVVPFALWDLSAFLSFPEYYLGTMAGEAWTGVGLWHFLHQVGVDVPPSALTVAMLGGIVVTYILAYLRRLDPVRAGFLLYLPFLLFFPKIHEPYYLIAVAFMAIFAAREERFLWLGVAVFVAAHVSALFSIPATGGDPIVPTDGAVILLPLTLVVCVNILLLYTAWWQLGKGDEPILPIDHLNPQTGEGAGE